MIPTDDRNDTIDGAAIDRLVDGDLSEFQRRELLIRLENDPEGWRRCAMAFLEHQAFREALVIIPSTSSRPEVARAISISSSDGRTWKHRVSIAASVIAMTFAAGFATGGASKSIPGVDVAVMTSPQSAQKFERPLADGVHQVGSFHLVDGSGGEAPARIFPILSGPGLNDRWLRDQPPTVPDYVRARWERQGFQVEERRNLVSVELEDGRRVAIPVDEVKVDYVGQNPL